MGELQRRAAAAAHSKRNHYDDDCLPETVHVRLQPLLSRRQRRRRRRSSTSRSLELIRQLLGLPFSSRGARRRSRSRGTRSHSSEGSRNTAVLCLVVFFVVFLLKTLGILRYPSGFPQYYYNDFSLRLPHHHHHHYRPNNFVLQELPPISVGDDPSAVQNNTSEGDPDNAYYDPYYAFDDDVNRDPYQRDESEKRNPLKPESDGAHRTNIAQCRRVNWYRDLPINCNTIHELIDSFTLARQNQHRFLGCVHNKKRDKQFVLWAVDLFAFSLFLINPFLFVFLCCKLFIYFFIYFHDYSVRERTARRLKQSVRFRDQRTILLVAAAAATKIWKKPFASRNMCGTKTMPIPPTIRRITNTCAWMPL